MSLPPEELMRDRNFWLDFINDYKNLPVLWKANDLQASRKNKDAALFSLVQKVRMAHWPAANMEFIKQRINNFRRTFINEYIKVQQSKQNRTKPLYVPSLYYYNSLKFLKEDESVESDISVEANQTTNNALNDSIIGTQTMLPHTLPDETIRAKEKRFQTFDNIYSESDSLQTSNKRFKLVQTTSKTQIANVVSEEDNCFSIQSVTEDITEEPEQLGTFVEPKVENGFSLVEVLPAKPQEQILQNSQSNAEDEYDVIAKRVATHLRNMDPEQCLYAEKLVFDVCISGRLKRLTAHSSLLNSQLEKPPTYFK